jgi:hypothetical protein
MDPVRVHVSANSIFQYCIRLWTGFDRNDQPIVANVFREIKGVISDVCTTIKNSLAIMDEI